MCNSVKNSIYLFEDVLSATESVHTSMGCCSQSSQSSGVSLYPPERDVSVSTIMWGIFSPPLHFCASLCTDFTSFSHGSLSELHNWYVEKTSTKGFHMERLWLKRLFLTLSVPEGISTQIWQRTLGQKLTRHIECLTTERLFKALNQQPDTIKTQHECGGRSSYLSGNTLDLTLI